MFKPVVGIRRVPLQMSCVLKLVEPSVLFSQACLTFLWELLNGDGGLSCVFLYTGEDTGYIFAANTVNVYHKSRLSFKSFSVSERFFYCHTLGWNGKIDVLVIYSQ